MRQVEHHEIHLSVVGETLALIAEHGLRDRHLAEGKRHAEHFATVEQALDVGVGLALGLGVPVAVERRYQCTTMLQVQFAHLIGAALVKIDRAVVDGGVGTRGLGLTEQLAG